MAIPTYFLLVVSVSMGYNTEYNIEKMYKTEQGCKNAVIAQAQKHIIEDTFKDVDVKKMTIFNKKYNTGFHVDYVTDQGTGSYELECWEKKLIDLN